MISETLSLWQTYSSLVFLVSGKHTQDHYMLLINASTCFSPYKPNYSLDFLNPMILQTVLIMFPFWYERWEKWFIEQWHNISLQKKSALCIESSCFILTQRVSYILQVTL